MTTGSVELSVRGVSETVDHADNGGNCVNGQCQCPDGFGGMYCEDRKQEATQCYIHIS